MSTGASGSTNPPAGGSKGVANAVAAANAAIAADAVPPGELVKRSVRGLKSTLTQRIGLVQRAVIAATKTPSERNKLRAEDTLDDAIAAFTNYEMGFHALIGTLSNEDADTAEASYATAAADLKVASDSVAVLLTPTTPSAASPSTNPGSNAQMRIFNTELKPDILTQEFKPFEFASWASDLEKYFESNDIDSDSPKLQQAYILKLLSPEFRPKVEELLQPTDQRAEVVAVLKQQFLSTYPLFARKVEWFKLTRPSGVKRSDWLTTVITTGQEAEIGKMDEDELFVHRILASINDERLCRNCWN